MLWFKYVFLENIIIEIVSVVISFGSPLHIKLLLLLLFLWSMIPYYFTLRTLKSFNISNFTNISYFYLYFKNIFSEECDYCFIVFMVNRRNNLRMSSRPPWEINVIFSPNYLTLWSLIPWKLGRTFRMPWRIQNLLSEAHQSPI